MKHSIYLSAILLLFSLIIFVSCQKEIGNKPTLQEEIQSSAANHSNGHLKQTKTFSSEVALKWLDMKRRLIQQADQLRKPGFVDQYQDRYFAYVGIALYESVVPGMPSYQSLSGQLTDMPQMPQTEPGKEYHWAASANAALAFIHKGLLYSITAANKLAVDSLEQALNVQYQGEADAATIQRSVNFGRSVAQGILNWSETDGAYATYPTYVLPTGPGLWVPTPPNFAAPTLIHYGNLRPLMPGVLNVTLPTPPLTYSINPSSDYYKSMKEVYDASITRTAAESDQALYWRSNVVGWFGILKKVAIEQSAMLDQVALADCKMGIAVFDAAIANFKSKYTYNVQRPVTFIRSVMGYTTWNSLFAANANPDYPDGLVPDYSSSAGTLSSVFGNNYYLNTDDTNLNTFQGYIFNSFEEAAIHGGNSRFIAGVTTKPAVTAGLTIGFKTAEYMDTKIKFLKDE